MNYDVPIGRSLQLELNALLLQRLDNHLKICMLFKVKKYSLLLVLKLIYIIMQIPRSIKTFRDSIAKVLAVSEVGAC